MVYFTMASSAGGEIMNSEVDTHRLSHTSREVNEARWPHTCSRPCSSVRSKKEKIEKKKITGKSAPPSKHHEIHSSPATA